ncbi:DoxX family protein [Candidatus Woesearchaeota archaeon]|nr:DoxX family protein [Candidatus Woesearchaeota archaeon]
MENVLGNILKKYSEQIYVLFRVLVGLLFLQHGAQKLFGWFGAQGTVQLYSLMGLAGVIEFFGGLAIVLGLFTRLAALGSAVTMLVAYFKVHFSLAAWLPIVNKGELALLYFAAFLVLLVWGAGKLSLEKVWLKKELF